MKTQNKGTKKYIMAMVAALAMSVVAPSYAATLSYSNWSESGSDTVIPIFTVNDDEAGKFRVDVNINTTSSPNDFAKITGIYFDLGENIITQADITNEVIGGSLTGHTHFASNASKINGVTNLNLGKFETVLGYKQGSNKADAPLSFYVSDHGGSLTLADWGKVGVRFQSVGENAFGGGSDKEMSDTGTLLAPTPTPIPAAAWLFGTGIMGFIGMAKKRKKA